MLTRRFVCDIMSTVSCDGEVSEWFKELVLKTSDAATHRGFESHPFRQLPKRAVAHATALFEWLAKAPIGAFFTSHEYSEVMLSI